MTPQQEAMKFVKDLNDIILFPVIALMSGIALLFFVYGAAEYILNAESETAREQGKKHITYGLIGLVVMLSAYAILSIATGTFGLSQQQKCAVNPNLSGCNVIFKIPNPGGPVTPPANPGGPVTPPNNPGGPVTPPTNPGGPVTPPV